LASFQVGWPKKIIWPFGPHLKLVGLKKFVWLSFGFLDCEKVFFLAKRVYKMLS